MYRHVAILAFIAVTLGVSKLKIPSRDSEVSNDDINQVPYYGVLLRTFSHGENVLCGVAIISNTFCITAVCGFRVPLNYLQVSVGPSILGGIMHNVKELFKHPKYKWENNDYNVGIIQVSTKFIFTATVKPIALTTVQQKIPADTMAVIGKRVNKNLVVPFTIRIFDNGICRTCGPLQRLFENNRICADTSTEAIVHYYGGVGGPLVVGNVLVGIVSWTTGCDRVPKPTPFAHIMDPNTRDFIRRVTNL